MARIYQSSSHTHRSHPCAHTTHKSYTTHNPNPITMAEFSPRHHSRAYRPGPLVPTRKYKTASTNTLLPHINLATFSSHFWPAYCPVRPFHVQTFIRSFLRLGAGHHAYPPSTRKAVGMGVE